MKKKTMQDYIKETPEVCRNNIQHAKALVQPLLDLTKRKNIKAIWLVASGSSFNGCHCARAMMRLCLDCEIKIVTPFTFTYYEHEIEEEDLILVISQSGLSTNAIESLKKLKTMHHATIALTGNPNSDIKDYADYVIDYGAKEELVGYVTKGVTTLCLFLMIFAIEAGNHLEYYSELEKAIDLNEEMIGKTLDFLPKHYKNLTSMRHIYFCGAGSNYGTALEGTLKAGETIHIPSCCYEIEEFIHGPNLQLTPEYNVVFFDGGDEASERVKQVYLATRKVSDRVYMISNNPDLKQDSHVLSLSQRVMSECAPLSYLPFVQLLSYVVSSDLNSVKQHPLLKDFKKAVSAKTENFVNYDEDE